MKIISGGQTGADLGGLEGALAIGLETGGTAPSNYYTEEGPNYILRDVYGLTADGDFRSRTIKNIVDSDATLIFASQLNSPGTRLTMASCREKGKPYLTNPSTGEELIKFCLEHSVKVLNIAGNRESKAPGIQEKVKKFIIEAFGPVNLQDDPGSEYETEHDRWVE